MHPKVRNKNNNGFLISHVGLTGTVAELEADMRAPEDVDRDGQLD